ncbi:RNA polymerase sigma factor SigE [Janibacter sp. Y6]
MRRRRDPPPRAARTGGDVSTQESLDWTPPTWHEVVEQHGPQVYRLAYRLTGDHHDAEDLTHDVFVRVFRSLDSYSPGTFEGWLHRITTNLFLDRARRSQRLRFDAIGEGLAARLRTTSPDPYEVYERTHLDADIQAALDALPPQFRAAVVLCDLEGLTYEEVADVLGVKLGTVRSRIHRGRARLRESLAHRQPAERPSAPRRTGGGRRGRPTVSGFPVAAPAQ